MVCILIRKHFCRAGSPAFRIRKLTTMTRDYSRFLPFAASKPLSGQGPETLRKLGWRPFFIQQCDVETLIATPPARVCEVHRTGLRLLGDGIDTIIPPIPDTTVGDWLLLDRTAPTRSTVLNRSSVFERRAPGHDRKLQLIASNVDTVFIVSSCNKDFNIARLERYIALAFEAAVTPVILLTKADLCEDPAPQLAAARAISDRVLVEALDALRDDIVARLSPWCATGQTIAFLGSSGVGKSTLVNALMKKGVAETAGIREDDSKGRHTTTRRQLHFTSDGCAILDTPGMRELQLTDVGTGISELFDDLVTLAGQCRFRDCQHESEPGCAIRQALDEGALDMSRMMRWRKLAAEERFNSATLAERKAHDRSRHKMHRSIQQKEKW